LHGELGCDYQELVVKAKKQARGAEDPLTWECDVCGEKIGARANASAFKILERAGHCPHAVGKVLDGLFEGVSTCYRDSGYLEEQMHE